MNRNQLCTARSLRISQNRNSILYKILSSHRNHQKSQHVEIHFPQELIVKINLFLHKNCLQFDSAVYLKLPFDQLKLSKKYVLFKKQFNCQSTKQMKSLNTQENFVQLQQLSSKKLNSRSLLISKQNYNFRIIKQWRKINKNQQKQQTIIKNHRHFMQFLKDFDVRYQSYFQQCSHNLHNVKFIKNNYLNSNRKKTLEIMPLNNQKIQRELSLMLYYSSTKIINSQILFAMKSLMSNNIAIFQVTKENISNSDQSKELFIYFQGQSEAVFANKNSSTKNSLSHLDQNLRQIARLKRIEQARQFLDSLNLKYNQQSNSWKADDNFLLFEKRKQILEQQGTIMIKQLKKYNFQGVQISQTQDQ